MGGVLRADGARIALGDAVLENNSWGRGELRNGVDYRQSVSYGDSLSDGVLMEWRWPEAAGHGIRAYPEVFAGRKPWGPETGGAALPAPLSAVAGLSARFDTAWGGETRGFNVAFDLCVSSDPEGGPAAITHEIMVWLTAGGLTPAGAPAGRIAAGEISGALFARPEHGAGWSYLAVLADRETPAGALDIGALAAALQAGGHLPREGWLMSVELGAEVKGGAGWLEIRDFAVTRAPETREELRAPDPDAAGAAAAMLDPTLAAGP